MTVRVEKIKLDEAEKKEFDDISYDKIVLLTDIVKLQRLDRYMRCAARRLAALSSAAPPTPRALCRLRPSRLRSRMR